MNLPFYIARRYLFSKKSTNVINIISVITIVGVAVGTAALIVVLSVFNGLESFVTGRFNAFDPDIKITAKKGKTFDINNEKISKVLQLDEIENYTEVLQENALIKYNKVYHPFIIKGVGESYTEMTGIDSMMVDGTFSLNYKRMPVCVVGAAVSGYLSIQMNFMYPLKVYMPKRKGGVQNITSNPENAFKSKNIYPIGVFSIDQDVDNYIIAPLDFVRDLLDYKTNVSAVEIKVKDNTSVNKLKKKIKQLLQNDFEVKNRYEQKEFIYKIMESEKLIIFLILTFILGVASFNIIGSLTMLILDKKDDIETLRSLGANMKTIRKIFNFEGWLITFIGAVTGLLIGAILCWLQMEFGLIKLQGNADRLFITAYPVEMRVMDFVYIFATVAFIGFFASFLPVRYITNKYLSLKKNSLN